MRRREFVRQSLQGVGGTLLLASGIEDAGAETSPPKGQETFLPPAAQAPSLLGAGAHPLAPQLNRFFAEQTKVKGFKPTGLTRDDHLEIVRGQVRFFQKDQFADGKIKDPKGDSGYATPCYAHAVATLVASPTDAHPALLDSGMRAMDWSVDFLLESRDIMERADREKKPRIHRATAFFHLSRHAGPGAVREGRAARPARVKVWREKLTAFRPTGYDPLQNGIQQLAPCSRRG